MVGYRIKTGCLTFTEKENYDRDMRLCTSKT
jgi:hypothetical protein